MLIGTLVLLISAVGISYYWFSSCGKDDIAVAENALATEDLVFIGHINQKKINLLIDVLNVNDDPDPIALPVPTPDLFDAIYGTDPSLREGIDQIFLAMNAKESASFSLLVKSTLNISAITGKLDDTYDLEKLDETRFKLKSRQEEKEEGKEKEERECPGDIQKNAKKPKKESFFLQVSNGWFIFSSTEYQLDRLLSRIQDKSSPVKDLKAWQEFSFNKLISAALLAPQQATKGSAGSLQNTMLLKMAVAKNQEVRSIYAGVGINLLTKSLRLSTEIQATNVWAAKTESTIKRSLNDFKEKSQAYSETFSTFVDGLTATSDDDRLHIALNLSYQMIGKLPDVANEFMGNIFSFGNARKKSGGNVKTEERINENPWDYAINNQLTDLPPFDADSGNGKLASTIKGPFGFRLEGIAYNEEIGSIILNVGARVKIPEIPSGLFGLMQSGLKLRLAVNEIVSVKNEQLLRDEFCVSDLPSHKKKNHQPVELFNSLNEEITISKEVRLAKDVGFGDIEKIKGYASLRIPVDVKSFLLEARSGESIEYNGTRVYINSLGEDNVAFQVSGNNDGFLEIRALNIQGKVLSSNYGFSSGNKRTRHFHGKPRQLQVFIATNIVDKTVDFVIEKENLLKLKNDPENSSLDNLHIYPGQVSLDDWKNHSKAKLGEFDQNILKGRRWTSKPIIGRTDIQPVIFQLLHDKDRQWGYNPELQVLMPLIPELANNLSALELTIDQIPKNDNSTSVLTISPGYCVSGCEKGFTPYTSIDGVNYTVVSHSIDLFKQPGNTIDNISGLLKVNLPTRIARENIQFPDIGEKLEFNGISIKFDRISLSYSPYYAFKIGGEIDRIVNLFGITQSGEKVFPKQVTRDGKEVTFRFPIDGVYAGLEIVSVMDKKVLSYPFSLTADYPN